MKQQDETTGLTGIRNINNEKLNAEESEQFWSKIWDNEKEHEGNAKWLRELRLEKDNMKQNDINIRTKMAKEQVKNIPNLQSPGPDGVWNDWLNKFKILHECIA